jgi:hypothetical protein
VIKIIEAGHHLSYRIRRTLKPVFIGRRLFSCQDVDEAMAKRIEVIAIFDMPVERGGIELRQNEDPVIAGIEAIGYRYIDQTVFARKRYGWFRSFRCEGIQS